MAHLFDDAASEYLEGKRAPPKSYDERIRAAFEQYVKKCRPDLETQADKDAVFSTFRDGWLYAQSKARDWIRAHVAVE